MRMIKACLLIILVLLAAAAARAQSALPYAYAPSVGTSSTQILAQNAARKALIFFNPGTTNTCAICPALSRATQVAIACAVNGAGSITLTPGTQFTLQGFVGQGQPIIPSAWNAVCSGAGSPLTILEWE
jgi:hypothetical protein